MKNKIYLLLVFIFLYSCKSEQGPLPILGEKKELNGEMVDHYIPDFNFINQDSLPIDNAYFEDHIYIADFFFTSCPSICPIVTKQMLRIYEEFENEDLVKLLSYTMDPKRDTPARLKLYADNLEVRSDKWLFLTGDKKALHEISTDYFNVIIEDDDVPGGFNHTGKLILVDKDRHIRSFCEGTDADDVTEFMKDIKRLINEYEE